MNISSGREAVLRGTYEIFNRLGIPLLLIGKDGQVVPIEQGSGDDLGLFYFVPWIANFFSLSLDDALWYFNFGLITTGALVALIGFLTAGRKITQIIVSLIGILLAVKIAWSEGSIYLVAFFPLCFVPLHFYLLQKETKLFFLYSFLVGFVAAFSNSLRTHSGTALLIIVVTSIFFYYIQKMRKTLLPLVFLSIGFMSYHLWFTSLKTERNRYLVSQNIAVGGYPDRHVFWHAVYVGLGFITNTLGISFDDTCGGEKAKLKNKNVIYCSYEYETILKHEVYDLLKNQLHHVVICIWAKLGILFFYFLKYAGLGAICFYFYRKPWFIELSYLLGFFWTALPGILTIPSGSYIVGFFTLALLYTITSLNWALQNGLSDKNVRRFCNNSIKNCSELWRKVGCAW